MAKLWLEKEKKIGPKPILTLLVNLYYFEKIYAMEVWSFAICEACTCVCACIQIECVFMQIDMDVEFQCPVRGLCYLGLVPTSA